MASILFTIGMRPFGKEHHKLTNACFQTTRNGRVEDGEEEQARANGIILWPKPITSLLLFESFPLFSVFLLPKLADDWGAYWKRFLALHTLTLCFERLFLLEFLIFLGEKTVLFFRIALAPNRFRMTTKLRMCWRPFPFITFLKLISISHIADWCWSHATMKSVGCPTFCSSSASTAYLCVLLQDCRWPRTHTHTQFNCSFIFVLDSRRIRVLVFWMDG